MFDDTTDIEREIATLEQEATALRQRIDALHRRQPPLVLPKFTLHTMSGDTSLSSLFDGRDELIVIHNMGPKCSYCTLWADGFNGMVPHFESRAAFVVVNNETPEDQQDFAESRGWIFTMASAKGTNFNETLGFRTADGKMVPGVSVLKRREDGSVVRVTRDVFGPGDRFCGIWHLFGLLPGGAKGWSPKLRY